VKDLKTPVLLIIFNKIKETKDVFLTIQSYRPNQLFIAADGPRLEKTGEIEKCNFIKDWVLENIDWDCEIKTLFQQQNLGCGLGPATAISWFFDQVEEGIILEDDCVPDISFFEYCAELLQKYRYDNRISIISGANFDRSGKYSPAVESYFFSVFPFTWGWATWKRNWNNFDHSIKKWGFIDTKEFLKYLFDDIEFQLLWKKVFDDIYNKPPSDIWDYQFFFISFLHKQLSIIPHVNLVSNIGNGVEATHTYGEGMEMVNVPASTMDFPMVHPTMILRNLNYDIFLQKTNYGRIENITFIKKIKRWIKKKLKYKVKK
jgi:hypothetical protein